MAPVFDNATAVGGANVSSLTTAAFTVAAGATYLYMGYAGLAGEVVSSVACGATGIENALSFLAAEQGSRRSEYWYIKSPPTGSIKVKATFAGTFFAMAIGTASYTGVDTTTPHGTHGSASSSTGTVSVVLSSATGELAVDALACTGVGASVGAGQTQRWLATGAGVRQTRGSGEAGAASVTMSWSNSPDNHNISLIAVPLKPAAVTPTGVGAHGAMYPRMQQHIHQSWTVPRVG